MTKLQASDGACVGTCTFTVGANPGGIAFDGTNLGTFVVGTTPWGVAFDGANLWVANEGSNNVVRLPVFP